MLHAWLMSSKVFLFYKAQAYVYFFFSLFFKLPPRQLLKIHFLEIALILNSLTRKLWSLNISLCHFISQITFFSNSWWPQVLLILLLPASVLHHGHHPLYRQNYWGLPIFRWLSNTVRRLPLFITTLCIRFCRSTYRPIYKFKKLWRLKNIILTHSTSKRETNWHEAMYSLSLYINSHVFYFRSIHIFY